MIGGLLSGARAIFLGIRFIISFNSVFVNGTVDMTKFEVNFGEFKRWSWSFSKQLFKVVHPSFSRFCKVLPLTWTVGISLPSATFLMVFRAFMSYIEVGLQRMSVILCCKISAVAVSYAVWKRSLELTTFLLLMAVSGFCLEVFTGFFWQNTVQHIWKRRWCKCSSRRSNKRVTCYTLPNSSAPSFAFWKPKLRLCLLKRFYGLTKYFRRKNMVCSYWHSLPTSSLLGCSQGVPCYHLGIAMSINNLFYWRNLCFWLVSYAQTRILWAFLHLG